MIAISMILEPEEVEPGQMRRREEEDGGGEGGTRKVKRRDQESSSEVEGGLQGAKNSL